MADMIIKDGVIVDGTKSIPYRADILIEDGMIRDIGFFEGIPSFATIDAKNRIVMPGFIDVHRHADLRIFDPGFGKAELSQGITSIINGNCGFSAAPFPHKHKKEFEDHIRPVMGKSELSREFSSFTEYAKYAKTRKYPLNVFSLAGNGTIRIFVKGFDDKALTPDELFSVRDNIYDAFDAGACGISMGLMYMPEGNYTRDELSYIMSIVKKFDGIITVHLRSEGSTLIASLKEVAEIARINDVKLHISHLKAAGKENWRKKIYEAIEAIDTHRNEGVDITCDVYPYDAGATNLLSLLPPVVLKKGISNLKSILSDAQMRKNISQMYEREIEDWDNILYHTGWDSVIITSVLHDENKVFIGKNMTEISKITGRTPFEAAADLILKEGANAGIIIKHMDEKDVKYATTYEHAMIASDSIYPASGMSHPRTSGTFPRVLGKWVRDEKLLDIKEAVYKMSAFPAKRFALGKKGMIVKGYDADIVIAELDKINDKASYIEPDALPEGIAHVIISGIEVYCDRVVTNNTAGRFLERKV